FFTTARRGFVFLFLEPFLVVVAIKTEMGRPLPAKLKMSPIGNSSPVFYVRRLVASRNGAKQENRSCKKYEPRPFTYCGGGGGGFSGVQAPPPGPSTNHLRSSARLQ